MTTTSSETTAVQVTSAMRRRSSRLWKSALFLLRNKIYRRTKTLRAIQLLQRARSAIGRSTWTMPWRTPSRRRCSGDLGRQRHLNGRFRPTSGRWQSGATGGAGAFLAEAVSVKARVNTSFAGDSRRTRQSVRQKKNTIHKPLGLAEPLRMAR